MATSRRGGRLIELRDFSGGLNDADPSHSLPLNECTDIENFDIDYPGLIRTRKGYKKINPAPISSYPVRGVHQSVNSNKEKHVIIACGGKLWRLKERSGTFQEIFRESYSQTSWGSNLLTNGGFDTDLTGWAITNNGTHTVIERDTTHPYAGAGCLKIVTTEPTERVTNGNFATHTGDSSHVDFANWAETNYYIMGTRTYMGYTINGRTGDALSFSSAVASGYFSNCVFGNYLASDDITTNTNDHYKASIWGRHYHPGSDVNQGTTTVFVTGIYGLLVTTLYTGVFTDTYTESTQTFAGSATGSHCNFKIQREGVCYLTDGQQATRHRIDDASIKARPRFSGNAISPYQNIDPLPARRISSRVMKATSNDYTNMSLALQALYYTSGGALIRTDNLMTINANTAYQLIQIEIPANTAPSNAAKMKLTFVPSGYYDGYNATAAGHGWYIDEISVQEMVTTGTVTEFPVDEDVIPSFVNFMGKAYISGYDKNIKLSNGTGIELLPEYPAKSKYNLVNQNRLWLAGDPEYPSRLYYSNYTEGGDANPDSIDVNNFLDLDPDDGDKITGMGPVSGGIAIFKNNATFLLTGSNENDWFVKKVSDEIGCASHHSIAAREGNLFFFASPYKGIYLYNGTALQKISAKIESSISRLTKPDMSFGVIYEDRYYLFVNSGSATSAENEIVYVYSLRSGSWTKYTGVYGGCAAKRKVNQREDFLLGDSRDGHIYKFLSGFDDVGEAIAASFKTGDMELRGGGVESRVRKVMCFARSGTDEQEIAISYASDKAYEDTETLMSLEAAGTNKWGVGEWDVAHWEDHQYLKHTFVPAADSANHFRLKVSTSGKVPALFYGFTLLERERRSRA